MDLDTIIRGLLKERERLNGIIQALEKMNHSGQTAPGRKRRGRKYMDPDARKEVSERMTRYWARRRDGAKVSSGPADPAS